MNTKIAIEMLESLLTDNETGIATLGQNGDEVAIALYTELAHKESLLKIAERCVEERDEWKLKAERLYYVLGKMKQAVQSVPEMNHTRFDSLGIEVNAALREFEVGGIKTTDLGPEARGVVQRRSDELIEPSLEEAEE